VNQIPEEHGDPYELADKLDWPLGLLQDEKKVRTFICACCRLLWAKLPAVARQALAVAEGYIEGACSPEVLVNERVELWQYLDKESSNFSSPEVNAVRAVICCLYEDLPKDEMYDFVMHTLEFCNDVADNRPAQYQLLREIFDYPNP